MSHWANKYLMIPFKPFGCGEFVEEVLRKEFDVEYDFPKSVHSLSDDQKIIRNYLKNELVKTITPTDGDIVLMGGVRESCHVGVYFKNVNTDYVLHSDRKMRSSSATKISQLPMMGYYFEGFYTWKK